MKKILSTLTLLVLSLVLISCNNKKSKIVTHEQVFAEILIGYNGLDNADSVTEDIILPTTTTLGTDIIINWISANEGIISSSGKVNRPQSQNVRILLILEVTIDAVVDSRNFELTVLAKTNNIGEGDITRFTINFDTKGGTSVPSQEIEENGLVRKPNDPTREGFDFIGWFNNDAEWDFPNNTVKKNLTLEAKWDIEKPKFIINFDSGGAGEFLSQTIREGELVKRPDDPIKIDHDFIGWFSNDVEWDFENNVVTENLTLKAYWDKHLFNYRVEFDTVGGNLISDLTNILENSLITEPERPERENYVFAGWYTSIKYETKWDFLLDRIKGDTLLYAKWLPFGADEESVIFTVRFNSGTIIPVVPEFVIKGNLINEPEIPIRRGYRFVGWFKDEALMIPWNFREDIVSEDILLYASWHELPPQLSTPLLPIGSSIKGMHLAIGPYVDNSNDGLGYAGIFLIKFTNVETKEEYFYELEHQYNQAIGKKFDDWAMENMPHGTYTATYKVLGDNIISSDSDYFAGQSAEFVVPKQELNKPIITIVGNVLNWSDVINATDYELYINNEKISNIQKPYDLGTLTIPGEYTIKVVAKGKGYDDSFATETYVVENLNAPKLNVPQNLIHDDLMLMWDLVPNAVKYSITIDKKTITTTEPLIDLKQFDVDGNIIVYIVAHGDQLNYSDSDTLSVELELPNLLPRLESMSNNDHNGVNINGYNNGYYGLVIHGGHAPFLQDDWSGKFLFQLYDDNNNFIDEIYGENLIKLHTPGNKDDFYGKNLINGNEYQIHIILVAEEESNHRNSLPLVIKFTFEMGTN